MKRLVLLLSFLFLPYPSISQTRPPQRKQPHPPSELKQLERQVSQANEEYKQSLMELLRLREKALSDRQTYLAKVRALAASGQATQIDVERAEAEVVEARRKVEEVKKRVGETGTPPEEIAGSKPGPPRCELAVGKAPPLRGFSLHEDLEELKKKFPRARIGEPLRPGERTILISGLDFYVNDYAPLIPRPEYEGVDSIFLTYLDDKLASIKVQYHSDPLWHSDEEFAVAIARSLSLPSKGWQPALVGLELPCRDFTIHAKAYKVRPAVELTINGLDKEIQRRVEEVEKEKKAKFKP